MELFRPILARGLLFPGVCDLLAAPALCVAAGTDPTNEATLREMFKTLAAPSSNMLLANEDNFKEVEEMLDTFIGVYGLQGDDSLPQYGIIRGFGPVDEADVIDPWQGESVN